MKNKGPPVYTEQERYNLPMDALTVKHGLAHYSI